MDIESCVELPDGHLVNLSPRPQRQPQYQAYRAHYTATELYPTPPARNSHRVPPSELEDRRTSLDIMYQKEKTTKLPVPKSFAERAREQRNQTPSPTGIPKSSSAAFSLGGSGGPSADRDRSIGMRKIRGRFEKESPLSQRGSYIRSRESDRVRSEGSANSWQQHKHPVKTVSEVQPSQRGASNPRSGIPNPNTNLNKAVSSPRYDSRNAEPQNKWLKEGGQWVNRDTRESMHQRSEATDTTTDSSPRSHPSISPVSAEDSMTDCDWEDRFVVHMPSAKDPNPPTMTEDQIADYQRSIEKVHREGNRMLDPNTRPSPRGSPSEGRRNSSTYQERRRKSDQSKTNESAVPEPQQPKGEVEKLKVPASQPHGPQADTNYYSPDEIGKNRISTIWEESPTKPREKRRSHTGDGSFLGCKEINNCPKNPDEILLFSSGEDSTTLQPRPLAVRAKKRQKEKEAQVARNSMEKTVIQEEWSQVSRNSKGKHTPVTLCQEQECPDNQVSTPSSQGSSKENSRPRPSIENSPGRMDGGRGDDVFIITPTVTRTMLPTPTPEKVAKAEKKISVIKAQGLRRPGGTGQSGTGEAVKAVRAKAQVISTPAGLRHVSGIAQVKSALPSLTSLKTTPSSSPSKATHVISTPASKEQDLKAEDEKEKELKVTELKVTESKDADSKDSDPKPKDSPSQRKEKDKTEKPSSSIRGFIRTSGLARSTGLVRSPTESLATILRNGTESLRNRAESLRNGSGSLGSRKGSSSSVSQASPPTRDNSESSRSARSFISAKETPPSSTKSSPVKNNSRNAGISLEKPPIQEKPPAVEPEPPVKKATPPPEKEKTPEKPGKAEKQPPTAEQLSRAERLERFKEQARLRRATKVVEIAELDGQQVATSKQSLQANITDVHDDLHNLSSGEKEEESPKEISTNITITTDNDTNTIALSLIFEIVFLAITNMHKFALQTTDSPYIKFVITNILNMTRHCYHVFSTICSTISVYQNTGSWPKAKNDQAISRFLVEFLQAIVYLFILGFGALIAGRAAGYVVLVGTWIVWFARPFSWAFQCVTHALIT
ncbi:uncharacterized protein N7484_004956 [Penicillium longicatenatum]|uniref:uncharacterized protein n=1 Tax=Penicillium longicatenatum TaxID=1561947 RepID=UPI002547F179|nr:uncharacterized protein N7484_004956 [Penicillium longicatenatum]KAJ5651233.1 hypothetical protein N7484_004956 [Penicillium longicatenatum]